MTETMNWDDIRVFLATMRAPSLRKAAQDLGVSHPTARRRLNALEERLGLQLFDRRTDGLHATAQAVDLLEAAERVERAMDSLGRIAKAADPELRGPIRITLPEVLATDLLMPDFVAFGQRWPQIQLQIEASYGLRDLSRREADVALRFMAHGTLPDPDLAGRMAGISFNAIYGFGDQWIGWRGPEEDAKWISKTAFPDLPVRGALNEPNLQRSACAQGMGLTQLPCFFAEPLLTRRTEPEPAFDLWVLVHPDLRRSPRLRIFRDSVVAAVRRYQPRLEGRESP